MFNPRYVTTSRHGVHYLRFPIPQPIHPQRQQSCVKLSLGTRDPKEALHLARGLCYVGEHILRQMRASHMDYYAIRDFLTYFFKERLAAVQQRVAQQGRLSDEHKAALLNSKHFAEEALELQFYDYAGTDQQIDGLIEEHELSISKPSQSYEVLRTEFLTAQQEYVRNALKIEGGAYDLRYRVALKFFCVTYS